MMSNLTKISLVVLMVVCMADVTSANWSKVGGMDLDYVTAPTTPAYQWPWDTDNPDDVVAIYGAFIWPGNGGTNAGLLSVDNSIGSFDAYITQTIDLTGGTFSPEAVPGGQFGQQFVHWANPSEGNGSLGVWAEISYGNDQTQSFPASAATSAWQGNVAGLIRPEITPTELTIKIGIVKDPAVTTGTRSLLVEDVLLWTYWLVLPDPESGSSKYPQWDNFNFDTIPVGIEGDYNEDGTVDAADYTVWRDNLGGTSLPNEGGISPGTVNQADYDFWKSRFGATTGSGSGSLLGAVPEPTSMVLMLLAGLTLEAAGGRRRR